MSVLAVSQSLSEQTEQFKSEDSKLREIFQHVVFTQEFTCYKYPVHIFSQLDLYECACTQNTGGFHRFLGPRRDNLENSIVSELINNQSDKSQPIYLLSMGSGGLMGDFITLEKLVLAQFKNINIDCVDPRFKKHTIDRVDRIRRFFEGVPGVFVDIAAYHSIEEVPIRNYHVVMAVDYDGPLRDEFNEALKSLIDLTKACKRLMVNGFLALGIASEDIISGPQPKSLTKGFPNILEISNDLSSHLCLKDELVLDIVPSFFIQNVYLIAYAFAIAIEKSGLHYPKILVRINQKDGQVIPKFYELLTSFFQDSEVEVDFEVPEEKYDVILTREWEYQTQQESHLRHISSRTLTYIIQSCSSGGGILRQTGDLEDQREKII